MSLLNFSNNEINSDKSLEELRYLSNLRTLNIAGNKNICTIQPRIMKPLRNLQAIIASDIGVQDVSFLNCLPNLNTAILSRNSLCVFNADRITSLTKLSLGHNQFEVMPDFSSLVGLIELRMNNNLCESIPETLLNNKKLKILDVSHNRLASWDHVKLLARLHCLTNLSLKANPLPSPPDEATMELQEDISSDKLQDPEEIKYRHKVLTLFQSKVGAAQKLKVQVTLFTVAVYLNLSSHSH